MSAVEIWLTIAGLTAGTLITRNFFIVLGDRIPLPERVQHALRYAPACALTAVVAPELLTHQGAWAISLANDKLMAGAAAIVVGLTTRSLAATMIAGMGTLTLLRFI